MHNFVLYSWMGLLLFCGVACTAAPLNPKVEVAEFWNSEPCGARYLDVKSSFSKLRFDDHARTRYRLEPHIPDFAKFSLARGLSVLEVGVGIGADYEQWLRAGAIATGVDLSNSSLELTRQRCELAGLKSDLRLADAENLPFAAGSFDVVYSYGVMHHSPDTAKCLQEAWRVLKSGGQARIMLYHHVSVTGLLLWLRYGLWRGQSIRQCVYERLESPGTKTFTRGEARDLMRHFESVSIEQVFSPGDLLLNQPSPRFAGTAYRVFWKIFPRSLVRLFCGKWGLFLLIKAQKSARTTSGPA